MSINFPTSLDSLTNPTSSNTLNLIGHALQHSNANDAIEALEAKVGANFSVVQTSHDFKLSGVASGDKAVSQTGVETLTNKTLTSPQINLGSDATGDIYYRNASALLTRLPAGAVGSIIQISASGIPEYIANPAAADATYTVKGVSTLKADSEYYAADAGANDTYVITLSPAPNAYVTGMVIRFKANTVNTGAATINVNSLGAKSIIKGVSTVLADGDIAALSLNTIIYDGTNFVLQNPVANNVTSFSNKIYVTTTNVVTTGATADILTTSIIANTLGTNNGLWGRIYFSWDSTTVVAKQVLLKYGATTLATLSMTPDATTGTTQRGCIDFTLLAAGTTATQEGSISLVGLSNNPGIFRTVSTVNLIPSMDFKNGTSTEDSTGALNLTISIAQHSGGGDTFTMVHGFVQLI